MNTYFFKVGQISNKTAKVQLPLFRQRQCFLHLLYKVGSPRKGHGHSLIYTGVAKQRQVQ
jgi:hypothetical protein